MSDDLSTQLARYGAQIRDDHPVLTVDDVAVRGDWSVVVGDRAARPPKRMHPGLAVGAGLAAVILIGFLPLVLNGTRSETAGSSRVTRPPDLGVFEPIRGRIMYPSQGRLEAVDPDEPSVRHTLDLPRDAGSAVPIGWSADGALLALVDEGAGHWFVMDSLGVLRFRGDTTGCCLFVHSNWLSPDGTLALLGGPEGFSIVELSGGGTRPVFESDQLGEVSGIGEAVWSPDGSAVAFAVGRETGTTLAVVEVETGAVRELVSSNLGLVRHLAWSPNGAQLLVTVANLTIGDDVKFAWNPLADPMPSRLYLVDVVGSGLREIASGHYVATAWSPDGTRLAALDFSVDGGYWRSPSVHRQVLVMENDGSGLRALPHIAPSGPFTGLAWHPVP